MLHSRLVTLTFCILQVSGVGRSTDPPPGWCARRARVPGSSSHATAASGSISGITAADAAAATSTSAAVTKVTGTVWTATTGAATSEEATSEGATSVGVISDDAICGEEAILKNLLWRAIHVQLLV